jgi:hypothetical protein
MHHSINNLISDRIVKCLAIRIYLNSSEELIVEVNSLAQEPSGSSKNIVHVIVQ